MEHPGALYERELEDGRVIVVYPLLMGTVRVCIGPSDDPQYDDAWCYENPAQGVYAAAVWDGDGDPPDGWFRNLSTARRRTDGDPAKEYIAR